LEETSIKRVHEDFILNKSHQHESEYSKSILLLTNVIALKNPLNDIDLSHILRGPKRKTQQEWMQQYDYQHTILQAIRKGTNVPQDDTVWSQYQFEVQKEPFLFAVEQLLLPSELRK
jgi:hypothetical protein